MVSKIHQKQSLRRAEILGKVMNILKVTPFEEVSVQDICKAAGVSVGSFYHYFGQKSELLVGLMGLIDVYMVDHVFPLLTSESAYEDLKAISRGFAAYVEDCGIVMSKLISRSLPTENNTNNVKRPLYEKMENIISKGQQNGELKTYLQPDKTADLLLIAMSGVSVDWARREGNYSITDRMEEFTDLFFPALLCIPG